jgi:hypothetical protein
MENSDTSKITETQQETFKILIGQVASLQSLLYGVLIISDQANQFDRGNSAIYAIASQSVTLCDQICAAIDREATRCDEAAK